MELHDVGVVNSSPPTGQEEISNYQRRSLSGPQSEILAVGESCEDTEESEEDEVASLVMVGSARESQRGALSAPHGDWEHHQSAQFAATTASILQNARHWSTTTKTRESGNHRRSAPEIRDTHWRKLLRMLGSEPGEAG